MTPEILDANLPLITAMRAAVERNQILQIDGNHAVLCDRLLPGYVAIVGGGERSQQNGDAQ